MSESAMPKTFVPTSCLDESAEQPQNMASEQPPSTQTQMPDHSTL